MEKKILVLTLTGLLLGSCGHKTPDAQNVSAAADNMANSIDNQASAIKGAADNMSNATDNAVDALKQKADAVRAAGENKADAIDAAAKNTH